MDTAAQVLATQLSSQGRTTLLEALQKTQEFLSCETNHPSDQLSEKVVALLSHRDPTIVSEATFTLHDVAEKSHSQAQNFIDAGAIPRLFDLLVLDSQDNVIEQAIWALGILAESPNTTGRLALLEDYQIFLPRLQGLLQREHLSGEGIKSAAWVLKILLCGNPTPTLHLKVSAYNILGPIISFTTDQETITQACWAVSYVVNRNDSVQIVLQHPLNCLVRLVQLLDHQSFDVVEAVAHALGNITGGTDAHTLAVVERGFIEASFRVFQRVPPGINFPVGVVKDCYFALANVATVSSDMVQRLLDLKIFGTCHRFLEGSQAAVSKEILYLISNAMEKGTSSQIIDILGNHKLLPFLVRSLLETEADFYQPGFFGLHQALLKTHSISPHPLSFFFTTCGVDVKGVLEQLDFDLVPEAIGFLQEALESVSSVKPAKRKPTARIPRVKQKDFLPINKPMMMLFSTKREVRYSLIKKAHSYSVTSKITKVNCRKHREVI